VLVENSQLKDNKCILALYVKMYENSKEFLKRLKNEKKHWYMVPPFAYSELYTAIQKSKSRISNNSTIICSLYSPLPYLFLM